VIGSHRELATAEVVFDRVAPDGWADLDTPLQVRAVLDQLPPAHRAVLVLRDLEDLSEQETAEALGVEVGTVKSRLHRARVAFRQRWRP
jgi:DNA-directed RNA polymerase specialized sigma24 family protein